MALEPAEALFSGVFCILSFFVVVWETFWPSEPAATPALLTFARRHSDWPKTELRCRTACAIKYSVAGVSRLTCSPHPAA